MITIICVKSTIYCETEYGSTKSDVTKFMAKLVAIKT